MPHTWTVNHLVSYLSIFHQVFSTFEAFVELRDPPWCNDLSKEKAETVDPATQSNQHTQNGAAKLPSRQGRGRSTKAQNGSGHCPEKQRFIRCLIKDFFVFVCQLSVEKMKIIDERYASPPRGQISAPHFKLTRFSHLSKNNKEKENWDVVDAL